VANTSMQQASELTSLNGKPLIVLTADEGITDDQWQSKQDRMATLSTSAGAGVDKDLLARFHVGAVDEGLPSSQCTSGTAAS
jgi:hypothetical protein